MLTKALRPLPEKWAGLQDPDLQQRRRYLHLISRRGAAPGLPRARRRAQDDPPRAGRARVRRVRGPDAADDRRRRERAAVHDASPRARHPDEAADQPGAVPQADARRRGRARLRARPQLPQRGHRPRPQPGVHDARGLPGLRRLPHDDGALRDARAGMLPRREPDRRPRRRRSGDPGARPDDRPRRAVRDGSPCWASVSEAVGEQITLEHADLRAVAERHDVPVDDAWGPGKIVQELFEKLVEEHDRAADVRVRLPARGLAARAAAPRQPRADRALRPGRRRASSSSPRSPSSPTPTSSARSSSCSRR